MGGKVTQMVILLDSDKMGGEGIVRSGDVS